MMSTTFDLAFDPTSASPCSSADARFARLAQQATALQVPHECLDLTTSTTTSITNITKAVKQEEQYDQSASHHGWAGSITLPISGSAPMLPSTSTSTSTHTSASTSNSTSPSLGSAPAPLLTQTISDSSTDFSPPITPASPPIIPAGSVTVDKAALMAKLIQMNQLQSDDGGGQAPYGASERKAIEQHHRRRLANREHARRSREKQRAHTKRLEEQVAELTARNALLERRCEEIMQSTEVLKTAILTKLQHHAGNKRPRPDA